jgi:hypothetical protein
MKCILIELTMPNLLISLSTFSHLPQSIFGIEIRESLPNHHSLLLSLTN